MQQRIAYIGLVLLVLAGCGTDKEEDKKIKRTCPQTAIVHELEQVRDYGKDPADAKSLVAMAAMRSIDGTCEYSDDGVSVDFTLALSAEKGPRLGGGQFGFSYFISVVDTERKITAKDLMTATFKFSGDKKAVDLEEPLHVFIPLKKDEDAKDYQVLMGFQLTEEQIGDTRKDSDTKIEKIIGR